MFCLDRARSHSPRHVTAASQHTCPRLCVQLITLDSVAVEVRQAAAVNFKNTIKYHWVRPALN